MKKGKLIMRCPASNAETFQYAWFLPGGGSDLVAVDLDIACKILKDTVKNKGVRRPTQ